MSWTDVKSSKKLFNKNVLNVLFIDLKRIGSIKNKV